MNKILLLLFVFSYSLSHGQDIITQEGYGNFLLGKTTLQSIYQDYPNAQHLIYKSDKSQQIDVLHIKDLGLDLFFPDSVGQNPDSVYLFLMEITAPCMGKTEKNICIGSSITEVINAYEKTPYTITEKEAKKSQLLNYNWIMFYSSKGKIDRISIKKSED